MEAFGKKMNTWINGKPGHFAYHSLPTDALQKEQELGHTVGY